MFWIVVTALALISAGVLALALMRGRPAAESAAAYDLRVYRDQLKDVDRDLARGVLAEADADRARTEISRRILAADAALSAESAPDAAQSRGWIGALALGAVLLGGSLGLYQWIGQPGYGDLPRSLREAAAAEARANRPSQAQAEAQTGPQPPMQQITENFRTLVQQLRDTVADRPDDLEGHILLARNEAILGNFAAAARAQQVVLTLKGDAASGREYLNLADMLILAAGGYVSPEAEAVLEDTLKREPTSGGAQYYWGLMYAQTGRPDMAFRIWSRLLAASPPQAPWVPLIRAQIEDVAALAGEVRYSLPPLATAGPTPGPSAEDIEAASDMSDEDRQAMIRGMVDGLAERLATEGGTAEEWARLIRALGVLGDVDRARAIWQEAQQVFGADAQAVTLVTQAARDAGVTE